jgi:peptidoglycan/xylan/chitin deacetylase (PgdA/CDA1 family)
VSAYETALRLGLEAVHLSGFDRLAKRMLERRGVIFALHRVKPTDTREFAPNRLLEVTPEFLDQTIATVRKQGFEIVTMDDAVSRLSTGQGARFACFTLDDAYRDNREYALPVFEKHAVPFTIYVPEHFADGKGELWWVELELAIERQDQISSPLLWPAGTLPCRTVAEKRAAFKSIYWRLRRMDEADTRRIVRQSCVDAGVDVSRLCSELIMDWDELRALSKHPLVTLGAHTVTHYALGKLPEDKAKTEIEQSRARLEQELAIDCRHFCYPYGDAASAGNREFELTATAGFASAVTMRKGLLQSAHIDQLHGLPRCSLNGEFQSQRYVEALLSGAPFLLWNLVRGDRTLSKYRNPNRKLGPGAGPQ